jgi:AraC-like DNA-binding protein
MLRLDRQAFVDEYRRRYGITPSAREWMAWYDFDKRRLEEARRCGSRVKSRGERR